MFGKNKKTSAADTRKPECVKRAYLYALELRCRGRLVLAVHTDKLGECVKIGHAADNDWVLPPQDRLCADYHAELHLGAKQLKLQACGKNTLHLGGRQMSSAVLKPGVRVSFGDCELQVNALANTTERPSDVHHLEFRSGEREGEMLPLTKPLVKIGSSPENDIVIKDDVVSAFHAVIRITENGESWLRDLDSVNGTFVNGARLGHAERMLMDSDEISFACHDMLFLDRNVAHTRSHIGRKLMVMALTVAVIMMGFGVFYRYTPHASQLLEAAEFYIRRAEFDSAQRLLDKMPEAREYQQFERHRIDYTKNIARYRLTFTAWNKFKDCLSTCYWDDAVACLGGMSINDRLAWNWDDSTADDRMVEAKRAKQLLELHSRIRHVLSSMDFAPEDLKPAALELHQTMPKLSDNEPEWLQPLLKDLKQYFAELDNNVECFSKMTATLQALQAENTQYKPIMEEMKRLQSLSSGCVRLRAQDLIDVLDKQQHSYALIAANQNALVNLQFGHISRKIGTLTPDECLLSPYILEKRDYIRKRQEEILRNAENLEYQLKRLKAAGLTAEGKAPEFALNFVEPTRIANILKFECLQKPMPNANRTAPADDYDRMFGVRYFFDIMEQSSFLSTNLYSNDIVGSLNFEPECLALAEFFRAVEETKLWLSLPDNDWMLTDEIKKLYDNCNAIIKMRSDFLAVLKSFADAAPGERSGLVARAAYFYFASSSTISEEEMKSFALAWRRYRTAMQELTGKYDPLKPEKAKEITAALLARGIPGDPSVTWVWSQKK